MTDREPGRAESTEPECIDQQEWEKTEEERLELELLRFRFEGLLVTSVMVVLGAAALTVGSALVLTGQWSYGGPTQFAGVGVVMGLFGLLFGVPQGLMAFRGLRKCKALVVRLTAALDRTKGDASPSRSQGHG